jgi:hypothetical protein
MSACECGCCQFPDHGACPSFEQGHNGRCVWCDHAEGCHERDKDKPRFNGPLGVGLRLGHTVVWEAVGAAAA